MGLEDKVRQLRRSAIRGRRRPVLDEHQGVTKARIRDVLRRIDRATDDTVDVVFALLDERPSWFPKTNEGTRFCDGASTAHIGSHVGILQRGRDKLDREGRDYWIKPLRDVGAIEAVTLKDGDFVAGHITAKSSNSAYRLSSSFVDLLQSPAESLEVAVETWIADEAVRGRLALQQSLAEQARQAAESGHSELIEAACTTYLRHFLPGYEVLFRDEGDGERIPEAARQRLAEAGLEFQLEDPMPDALLWNPKTGQYWVIEAVTSDGEVDIQKVELVRRFINRTRPEASVGFTTAYRTWKEAAVRQGRHKNLAPGTCLWILEDGSKQLKVEGAL